VWRLRPGAIWVATRQPGGPRRRRAARAAAL